MLSGTENAWLVYKGTVDVFAVQTTDNQPSGARHHFFRASIQHLLLGLAPSDWQVGLLASCTPETQILQFKAARLRQLIEKDENVAIIVALLELVDAGAGVRTDGRDPPQGFPHDRA